MKLRNEIIPSKNDQLSLISGDSLKIFDTTVISCHLGEEVAKTLFCLVPQKLMNKLCVDEGKLCSSLRVQSRNLLSQHSSSG